MSILGLTVLQVLLLSVATAEDHHVLFLKNRCSFPIWPTFSFSPLLPTNLSLAPNSAPYRVVVPEPRWQNQIWARTGCNENGTQCETGVCTHKKDRLCLAPTPVTRAYFAFDGAFRGYAINGTNYEVQLANGFNVPLVIIPGRYNKADSDCKVVGCFSDVKAHCPSELAGRNAAGKVISCKSPCEVFDTEYYCAKGRYLDNLHTNEWNPEYRAVFNSSCPHVGNYFGKYSYYLRDPYSVTTQTCTDEGANRGQFTIQFC